MTQVIMSSRLKKILNNGPKKACVEAIKETLEEATTMCKDEAPVDTGALRDGISSQQSDLEGKITSAVDYWVYVNYGTINMQPQPFVTDTAEKVPQIFDENFKKEFEEL